jgi:Lon protease-like protein
VVRPVWEPFAVDLAPPQLPAGFDRGELLAVLKAFLASNDLAADWSSIESAPPETLINSLAMVCPFDEAEKQALLEAPTLVERSETLMTLMRLRAAGPDGGAA